jgi:hypothetical protein
VAESANHDLAHAAQVRFVVDDQHGHVVHADSPGRGARDAAGRRTTARPRRIPRSRPQTNGSNIRSANPGATPGPSSEQAMHGPPGSSNVDSSTRPSGPMNAG